MSYAQNQEGPGATEVTCPFFEEGTLCRASFSRLPVDSGRARHFCNGEDHDLCPLFLSKILRSTRLRYCGSQQHEFLHK
jgi:hypothetical protein